jgi:hemerythrin-like domain-containing protein
VTTERPKREEPSGAERLEAWVADTAGAHRAMHPVDELLAEHCLMRVTMAGMQQEALNLNHNGPLRPQIWSPVVDVIGNFIHRIHRAKEEAVFFPQLLEEGIIDDVDRAHLLDEHQQLKAMTLDLCDGVGEGDWEKVLRTAARYLSLMGTHLRAEEQRFASPSVRALPSEKVSQFRNAFAEIDTAGLGEGGRQHYLELARSICRDTGISFESALKYRD